MLRNGDKGLSASMWAPGNPSHYRLTRHHKGHHHHPRTTHHPAPYTTITPAVAPTPSSPSSAAQGSFTSPSTSTSTSTSTSAPHHELQKFEKIAQRLRWKLFQLSEGFDRATNPSSPSSSPLVATPESRAQAEFMFKLDFYEYYMLLERGLVHLMAVFGIVISREHRPYMVAGNGGVGAGASEPMLRDGTHAYHHNVLAALDSPNNPLHQVLGTGDARRALARAKELRNRWKYLEADEKGGVSGELPLGEYKLDQMLGAIFEALEKGYLLARERVEVALAERATMEMQGDVPWDFMVDAMDWEAV